MIRIGYIYDVTYDHFCSLQQAKVILFTLFVLSPQRDTLANSEGHDELRQA